MDHARLGRAAAMVALVVGIVGPAAPQIGSAVSAAEEPGHVHDDGIACTPAPGDAPDDGAGVLCVHGGDPPPAGAAIDERRSVGELAADTTASTAAAGAPTTTSCVGTGSDGNRVQAIYARSSDVADRSSQIVPLIRQWAAVTESSFIDSAAPGTVRRVRWVHSAPDTAGNCVLDVDVVTLGTGADDTFSATISALNAAGFASPARKYLVWMDANVYCGIAQLYPDSDTTNNYNDGTFAMYARVDNGCWGYTYPNVEAHELMHNLGAVQSDSPNHSPYGHCLDDKDTMCYADGPGVVTTTVCSGIENERLLDCNRDDYFSTAPAAGSYLASHWNTADSSFLHSGPHTPAPDPDPDPTVTTAYAYWSGTMTSETHTISRKVTPTANGTVTVRLKFTGARPARLRIYSGATLLQDVRRTGNEIVLTAAADAGTPIKAVVGADPGVKWILRVYYPVAVA